MSKYMRENAKNGWMDCNAYLPEPETEVLIGWDKLKHVAIGVFKEHWGEKGAFAIGDCGLIEQPSHWRPLVQPPLTEEECE